MNVIFTIINIVQVYTITMTMAGVPPGVVAEHKPYLSNMLGLIRGNIYYNLVSWYRCLTCIPIGDTSKYMETMMGVKQVKDEKKFVVKYFCSQEN